MCVLFHLQDKISEPMQLLSVFLIVNVCILETLLVKRSSETVCKNVAYSNSIDPDQPAHSRRLICPHRSPMQDLMSYLIQLTVVISNTVNSNFSLNQTKLMIMLA